MTGEEVKINTHVPHALTNTAQQPVELIGLFGPQVERMHVLARPRGSGED